MEKESHECLPEPMESEDRLFMLFTSGTTGEAKSITHTQAGYLLNAAVAHKVITYLIWSITFGGVSQTSHPTFVSLNTVCV